MKEDTKEEAAEGEMCYCTDCFLLDMWEWVWFPVPNSVSMGVRVVVDPTAIDTFCPPEEEAFFSCTQTAGNGTTTTTTTSGHSGETACVLQEGGEEFILLFGGLCATATAPAPALEQQPQSQSSLSAAAAAGGVEPALSLPKACANVTKIRVSSLLTSMHA